MVVLRFSDVVFGPSGGPGGRRPDALNFQLDVHAVADQHAAGLERLVPLQSEVLAARLVLAMKPARSLPQGSFARPPYSTSRVTVRVTSRMVSAGAHDPAALGAWTQTVNRAVNPDVKRAPERLR
jgi:hypothetical protein